MPGDRMRTKLPREICLNILLYQIYIRETDQAWVPAPLGHTRDFPQKELFIEDKELKIIRAL